ncbi:MAG: sulfatase-like hydrolase/transferase [Fulvivirga sp.]|uniref:LTA synthase family protein n=1 Tax=Fulvivirga sp. TaxID=1931237 RepID=UPI0032F01292
MIYQHDNTASMGFGEIILAMLNGARLDLTVAGYFTLIPGLLITLTTYFNSKVLKISLLAYTSLLLFVSSFIIVLDMELYSHWSFRMDATPLLYIGKEAAGSGDLLTTIIMVGFWLLFFVGAIYGYQKYIANSISNIEKSDYKSSLIILILTGLLIAPIRGTTGVAPINTGTVYFHESNMFANHTAINVVYNFGYAVRKINRLKYPENYLERDLTDKIFDELIVQDTTGQKFLNVGKPNVMIIMLESYSFRFIEPLGGLPGITPNINSLVHEGILFDNFYSSGDRTDMGIISVLNGYPRQPLGSIIKFPKKTSTLPYINKNLKARGYATEFTYGYNIDYANFKSYLTNGQFDNVTHSKDFPPEHNTSKWGVHDHFVFNKFLEEANEVKEPFFKIMMTQSSHEPFEVPMETVIKGDDNESMFKNSAYYTDKSLGEFIEKAKQTNWWDSTLIIITADHGHFMPGNEGISNPDRFKIPMLWLGGAINKRDTVVHNYGTHTDIANTLFAQLGFQDSSYTFSSNMFSINLEPFAVFIYNNGVGYLSENEKVIYDNTGKQFVKAQGVNETSKEKGRAYLQKLYLDFNHR